MNFQEYAKKHRRIQLINRLIEILKYLLDKKLNT